MPEVNGVKVWGALQGWNGVCGVCSVCLRVEVGERIYATSPEVEV